MVSSGMAWVGKLCHPPWWMAPWWMVLGGTWSVLVSIPLHKSDPAYTQTLWVLPKVPHFNYLEPAVSIHKCQKHYGKKSSCSPSTDIQTVVGACMVTCFPSISPRQFGTFHFFPQKPCATSLQVSCFGLARNLSFITFSMAAHTIWTKLITVLRPRW